MNFQTIDKKMKIWKIEVQIQPFLITTNIKHELKQ